VLQYQGNPTNSEYLISTVCGKRGGAPFVSAVTPASDGSCPSGTKKCSYATSALNTICYPVGDDANYECPITGLVYDILDGIRFDDSNWYQVPGTSASYGSSSILVSWS
jgi:hypothetical protein